MAFIRKIRFAALVYRELGLVTATKILTILLSLERNKQERWVRLKVKKQPLSIPVDSTNLGTFLTTFVYKFHLPGFRLVNPKVILDFGSNIGLTCFDFARLYPESHVFGWEIDLNNVEIARKVNSQNSNVLINHRGVSDRSGVMSYKVDTDSDAFSLVEQSDQAQHVSVEVESMSDILSQFESIDLVKIDIEGTELRVLKSLSPKDAKHVKSMLIEIHHGNEIEEITSHLRNLGFELANHERHWSALMATRISTKVLST